MYGKTTTNYNYFWYYKHYKKFHINRTKGDDERHKSRFSKTWYPKPSGSAIGIDTIDTLNRVTHFRFFVNKIPHSFTIIRISQKNKQNRYPSFVTSYNSSTFVTTTLWHTSQKAYRSQDRIEYGKDRLDKYLTDFVQTL